MKRLKIKVESHTVELSVSTSKLPYLMVKADTSIGTPLTRDQAVRMRNWLNDYFAKGCEKHGTEGCIECENRCQWCGDDGDMEQRDGDRVCENCAFSYDEGEIE